jgi:hypothetical protein
LSGEALRRKSIFVVALAFLLLFSIVLVFEVRLPEANAALFSDNFANLNNWTVVNGVWTSTDGVLQGTSTIGGQGLIWAGNTAWTNYKVTANVRLVNSGEASLVIRYKGPTDFYWLGLGCWGHKFSISKVVGGVTQELASSGLASEVEVGRWYLVSAVAVDGTLQLFVDGINVLQVQDNSLSKGGIGFRDWSGTMQAEYLNVESITWSKTYGTGTANSIIQSSDGGYVMAGSSLIKTDLNGNIIWNKTYGGSFSDVIQTSDSGYVVVGSITNLSGVYVTSYVYLVKTDSNGNLQWNTTYYPNYHVNGVSIIQTSDGGYTILGYSSFPSPNMPMVHFLIRTDVYGNEQWVKDFNQGMFPYSIIQSSDGGYVIVAKFSYIRSGAPTYAYLIKTDSSGNQLWQKSYGNCYLYSVTQTFDSGFMLAGYSYTNATNGNDVYLVKTDSFGNQLWNRTYGGTGDDEGNFGVLTGDGGYAITGYTNSSGFGGNDVYLVKTDSSGILQWKKTYGGTGDDAGYCVVQTSDGGYAISGSSGSNVFLVKMPSDDPPFTVDNYDRLWHTSTFPITLTVTVDEFTTVSNTYYKINGGSTLSVGSNGQSIISTEGTNNKLEYWSVDSLGNVESHHTLTGIKLDKTAPTGSIIINGGDASTASTAVTLALASNDATSGVYLVRYSNDGVWDTESWESATSSKFWTLTSGDETKTVYYQVQDNAGLLSSSYSDTIILETSPTPTPTPTPITTPTPTPTPTPSPTSTPLPTPTATPTSIPTPTPTPSPTPSPSPTAIPTTTPTPTPSPSPSPIPATITPTPSAIMVSPTPTPTPTPTPAPQSNPTVTPVTSSPSPIQNTSPTPSPLSQTTQTPLYIYVVAVLAIAAITISTIALIIKKKR